MDKNMTLEKRIDAELYSYQGRMSVFVDDLQGHTVERGADEEFEAASVIKAFLLAALYLQAERRMADLSAEIEYEASQFVDGSGMLRALGVGARPEFGSSQNKYLGFMTIARAMATRFCIPPEISPGNLCCASIRFTL